MNLDNHTAASSSTRCSYDVIPTAVVGAMKAVLPSSEKEVIMDMFGISSNTWQKVRKGNPIRASTAERLLDRLMRLGIVEDAHV